MLLVEIHPLRKDKSLPDGTQVMSTSLGSRLSFTNYEGSMSVHPASVHGLFSKVLVHSYHLSHIVDIYIHTIAAWTVLFSLQDAIRDKLFKENTLSRFPYQENTLKEWFKQSVPGIDHDDSARTISMLNLNSTRDPFPQLNGAAYSPLDRGGKEGFTVLCHGTDHESAKNIIEQGICLDELREDGDFGGKGFYLTEFEKARQWAFHRKSAKTAVLVFEIPNQDIDRYRENALDLMGPKNEKKWKALVTNKNIAREVRGMSFVEGPWIKRGTKGVKTGEQVPNSYQMCILDESMAEMIDMHLHSVVFYNTTKLEEDSEKKK